MSFAVNQLYFSIQKILVVSSARSNLATNQLMDAERLFTMAKNNDYITYNELEIVEGLSTLEEITAFREKVEKLAGRIEESEIAFSSVAGVFQEYNDLFIEISIIKTQFKYWDPMMEQYEIRSSLQTLDERCLEKLEALHEDSVEQFKNEVKAFKTLNADIIKQMTSAQFVRNKLNLN
jgi:hypothetical protein